MSGAGGHDAAREIARGLSQIVGQALDPGTSVGTLDAARDLARLLSLRGLDRLLGALSPHLSEEWPVALEPLVNQVRHAAAECGRVGDVEALRRLDEELALMAQVIERAPLFSAAATLRVGAGSGGARPATASAPVLLAGALEGLPVQQGSEELLRTVRLRPPVAGALRAALDWLLGDGTPRLRLWLASDGSALDVTCDGIAFTGVHPASEVLANVGAHLGPAGDRPGAWAVRVPILAERDTFLMLMQDELQIAVPWHAVARVRLMPADTIDAMARRQGLAVLEPLAVASRRAAEQPVVVVALGLKRACLVADRLVWRMPAQPVEAPGAPPAAGIVHAVRSDDGDLYWVLDPAWLLRGIAPPPVAEAGRRGTPPAPTGKVSPVASPARDLPPGPPPPIPFPSSGVSGRSDPQRGEIRSLRTEDVEALGASSAGEETEAAPTTPAPATSGASPAPAPPPADAETRATPALAPPAAESGAAPAPTLPAASGASPTPVTPRGTAATPVVASPPARATRRALVAEDSITARIFLARLLEQRGFVVRAVGTAAELRTLLPQGPWSLVCADIELPDAGGASFLHEVMRGAGATSSPLVALVRDAADESIARAAGVAATLRKPYEGESLERVLARLVPGLGGTGPRAGGAADPREWGAR